MGFEILLSAVLLIAVCHLQYGDSRKILTIQDFISDSNATNLDHTQAFQDAWKKLCGGQGGSLVVHANERYTIRPLVFRGPCRSPNIHIQIDGTIEAPTSVGDWRQNAAWLEFDRVSGLVLSGSGTLHSHGEIWWSINPRPTAVRFNGCQNLAYSGLTQINSPKNHISICSSTIATLSNIHLSAPGNSPNTDGIDISDSHGIHIRDSSIETGDDCVALQGGSYDINITSVACGPGHGISIGSLGRGGINSQVQNVNVRHCTFTGTQNAARIKTWPGGRGFVRNILYEDIILVNSRAPININQHYTGRNQGTAVKVSGVTFRAFRGTSADNVAINIDCARITGCDNIVLDHINMTPSSGPPLTAFCQFAHVVTSSVSIPINCNFRNAISSTPPPPPTV